MTSLAFTNLALMNRLKTVKNEYLLRNSLNLTAVLVMTEIAVPIWQLNFLSNSLYEFESKSKSELKQSRFNEVAKRPLFIGLVLKVSK